MPVLLLKNDWEGNGFMPDEEAPISLEERLNTLSSKLTELEDLQLVDKLDIINLKNELEQLKLTTSVPSPETLQRVKELGKIVENVEEFKKLADMAKNMDKIMAGIKEASPEGLEDMIRVVDDIDRRLRKLEASAPGIKPEEAKKYAMMIEELRSGFRDLPKGAKDALELSRQLEKLRMMVEENAKNMMELSRAVKRMPLPGRRAEPLKMAAGPAKPAVLRCPRCGAELPPHAKFCRACGAKVKEG